MILSTSRICSELSVSHDACALVLSSFLGGLVARPGGLGGKANQVFFGGWLTPSLLAYEQNTSQTYSTKPNTQKELIKQNQHKNSHKSPKQRTTKHHLRTIKTTPSKLTQLKNTTTTNRRYL
jgi:hypothetical protein